MRARNDSDRTAFLPAGGKRCAAGFRSAASLGVLVLVLASAAACSPPSGAGSGSAAPASTQASLPAGSGTQPSPDPAHTAAQAPAQAPLAAGSGTQPALDLATAAAKARVEAALSGAVAGGAKPGTDRARAALTDAGFTSGQQEVTASRTPTGLDADAVEAAVKVGSDCVVAQLRTGSVTVSVLPVLAGGRCLVGTPV
ncbi:DUF6993 domain-containing protein [Pseudarthrobacter albicanus]|uniref:DUF6993 domain-containing protein n=1 Tax=Pseudarthrobacter albicanus TaxID=2823873 RepID=UPI001FE6F043|nr:hypothetical protein [Pseudarthrobacter albicanus]